jgi:glycosyltransferase involved in cell wall biosynthesis
MSVVVPAYNEARNLPTLLVQLGDALRGLTDDWEVIVVDDGSRDDTALVMLPWTREPGVRYLRLSRNFGKECALTAGIDHAAGDVVVLMDADLQHPPPMIARMLAAWQRGADMVCTARRSREDERLLKRWGTKLFYWLVNRNPSISIPIDAGDFRLMDRAVVEALRALPERNRFMKGLYAWVGFRTEVIEYMPAERMQGVSSFTLKRLTRLAFTGVTAFTNFPLRLWSGVGAVVAVVALGYGLVIVVDHFWHGSDVAGWPTLVAGMMFFSGVQLISIGILGEYVGRIFDEVKQRPIYLIGAETGRATFDAQRREAGSPPPREAANVHSLARSSH